MKFIVAPDKFKNSLTSMQFCKAVGKGIRKLIPNAEIVYCPLADGGDGTLDVINYYLKADKITVQVSDPFFEPLQASYLFNATQKIAYIEMAEASGLKVLKSRKPNCMKTTSLGTGELIKDAINRGAKEIILGIGGSATNDAGMGIASALGYKFTTHTGETLEPIGENLARVANIESKKVMQELANVRFQVACDVENLFYGNDGASYVYAAQKGATPSQVALLDIGLQEFSKALFKKFKVNVQEINGSGAAGGVGGGSICFLKAKLISGIEMILKFANFSDKIKGAEFIITGEGLLDIQTLSGKTIKGIVLHAKKENIPVIAMCGSSTLTEEQQQTLGIDCVLCIQKGVTDLQFAIQNAATNLEYTAFNFASLVECIKKNTRS